MGLNLGDLLTETANRNQIIDAVKTKNVVTIYYAGDHIVNKGYRDVEIFCYGYSRWGHDCIRAWQTDGVTDTPGGKPADPLTRMPGWRMFRVDRIKSLQPTDEYFTIERPKFNPEDKDMNKIYIAADFNNTEPEADFNNPEVNTDAIPDTDFNDATPEKKLGFWDKIFGKKEKPTPEKNPEQSNTIQNSTGKDLKPPQSSSNEPVKKGFLKRIGDKLKTFLDKK